MRKSIVLFSLSFFLFLLVSPGLVYAGSPEYNQAYAVYQNQGAGVASPLFKKLADSGDSDSMWMLGYIYKNQADFDTKYAESAKWYKNYIQFPLVKKEYAFQELGELYMYGGFGLEKNLAQARIYFERLVESGWSNKDYSKFPSYNLTLLIGQQMAGYTKDDTDYVKAGKFFEKNKPNAAFAPLKQSAEYNNPDAMELLGLMYKYGIGVKQDFAEAVTWFRKAAEKELPYSMLSMGKFYDKGNSVTQDDATARGWYKKSALAGNEEAKTILTEKMKNDPLSPELAIEMISKMHYAKGGASWGDVVSKLILKPKWEYYFNEREGHVVKLRGYYDDPQKEKTSIFIVYLINCTPNIETGEKVYSIKAYHSSTKGADTKPGIPDWLAYELE